MSENASTDEMVFRDDGWLELHEAGNPEAWIATCDPEPVLE